jgi:hypothetical protein
VDVDWTRGGIGSGTAKLAWEELPAFVRAGVEEVLGSRVVSSESRPGGFTPGLSSVVELEDGGHAFVKSVADELSAEAAAMHRSEAEVLDGLRGTPHVPELLAAFEDAGWVTLVLGYVDGRHPHLPWQSDDLDVVLDGLSALAQDLTPAPLIAPSAGERLGEAFSGWRRLRGDPAPLADPWARRRLDDLAELESRWEPAAAGETLLHADLRADQILLVSERITVVDWAHACVGASWLDLVFLAPSVTLQGGPEPAELMRRTGTVPAVDPHTLTSVVAAVTGFFVYRATLPPIPRLPTVRAFQHAQGEVALRWLRARLDE